MNLIDFIYNIWMSLIKQKMFLLLLLICKIKSESESGMDESKYKKQKSYLEKYYENTNSEDDEAKINNIKELENQAMQNIMDSFTKSQAGISIKFNKSYSNKQPQNQNENKIEIKWSITKFLRKSNVNIAQILRVIDAYYELQCAEQGDDSVATKFADIQFRCIISQSSINIDDLNILLNIELDDQEVEDMQKYIMHAIYDESAKPMKSILAELIKHHIDFECSIFHDLKGFGASFSIAINDVSSLFRLQDEYRQERDHDRLCIQFLLINLYRKLEAYKANKDNDQVRIAALKAIMQVKHCLPEFYYNSVYPNDTKM